jgi:GTP-binding protein Era
LKSGLVSVVGRPNVGKSTLVNALVGQKVSITSSRPQTTRNTIRGAVTGYDQDGEPAYQIVLVDTPGLHKPRTELGNRLNTLVYGSLADADAALFLVDATQPIGPGDRLIAERLREAGVDVVVVVNKVDKAKNDDVVEQLVKASGWDFTAYVPVSALHGTNLGPVIDEVVALLPDGPLYFPAEMKSDQPEELLIGEIVREKFLERLRDELPHSLVVVTDDIDTTEELTTISARVIVERSSQKGIVIGKGGALLRDAGTEARLELERLLGGKVHLDLRVSVERDWQQTPHLLDRLGFR